MTSDSPPRHFWLKKLSESSRKIETSELYVLTVSAYVGASVLFTVIAIGTFSLCRCIIHVMGVLGKDAKVVLQNLALLRDAIENLARSLAMNSGKNPISKLQIKVHDECWNFTSHRSYMHPSEDHVSLRDVWANVPSGKMEPASYRLENNKHISKWN